jgi:hypothetical protein
VSTLAWALVGVVVGRVLLLSAEWLVRRIERKRDTAAAEERIVSAGAAAVSLAAAAHAQCRHPAPLPVAIAEGDVVAWLCPACDEQLTIHQWLTSRPRLMRPLPPADDGGDYEDVCSPMSPVPILRVRVRPPPAKVQGEADRMWGHPADPAILAAVRAEAARLDERDRRRAAARPGKWDLGVAEQGVAWRRGNPRPRPGCSRLVELGHAVTGSVLDVYWPPRRFARTRGAAVSLPDVPAPAGQVVPSQVRRPWRATVRTAFAVVVALAAMLPFLVAAAGADETLPPVAGALAIASAITRILALPAVDGFLDRFLPWLAADPQ